MARLPQLPDSPSPTHGQTLAYDSTIQRWVPSAPGSGGGTTDHTALSNRSAADQHPIGAVTGLQSALDGKAASSHTHNASDVNAGTLAIARIPTGTTSSTVALGNHTHTPASIGAAPASHTHGAADLSGVVKTVNGTAPDGSGNVVVSGGGGTALPQFGKAQLAPQVFGGIATLPVNPLIPAGATVSARQPVGASPVALPAVTLDIIAVAVTTAGATGALIRFGIYGTTATGAPGTLLWDSGDIAADTTGRKQITIPAGLTLPAGDYWTVCVSSDGTVRTLCWDPLAAARVSASDMMGGSNRRLDTNAATGAALPATLTISGGNLANGDSAVLFGRVKA